MGLHVFSISVTCNTDTRTFSWECEICVILVTKYAKEVFLDGEEERKRKQAVWVRLELKDTFAD